MGLVEGMSLAVYTTIYPGVESYLADWYRSLRHQTDQDFELWIGVDAIERNVVQRILGSDVAAHWVERTSGGTPAQIREEALAQIVETCAAVVLVDSDDVLHPTRIAAARIGLETSDLVACALCLIDQQGKDLGLTFTLTADVSPDQVLPRNNIFGFSNSAFRSALLQRCLPISSAALLVDWFLATRAWLLGARLAFDRVPRMDYRQHANNTARLRFPIVVDQVISDTALVIQHLKLVLAEPRPEFLADRLAVLTSLSAEIEQFHKEVVLHGRRLKDYVRALNRLRPAPLWWSSVANPALKHMWKSRDLEYENDKAWRSGDRSGEAALCYRRSGF
jgi:hypothetical protein